MRRAARSPGACATIPVDIQVFSRRVLIADRRRWRVFSVFHHGQANWLACRLDTGRELKGMTPRDV